jgi:ribosome-associated heat shock protein Hsp15
LSADDDAAAAARIDKWLWAARFFKSRSLAQEAVAGGKIRLNGERPKPAKEVRVGDRVEIHIGQFTHLVEVLAVSDRRGPPVVAATLYRESDESREERARVAARLRAMAGANPFKGRPTKRDRRQFEEFRNDPPSGDDGD